MNFVINMLAKFGGIAKLWGFLDGKKAKIAGAAGFLTGAAGILGQVISLIEGKDASAVMYFVKNLPNDPSWLTLLAGLGVLGLRHKLSKMDNPKP